VILRIDGMRVLVLDEGNIAFISTLLMTLVEEADGDTASHLIVWKLPLDQSYQNQNSLFDSIPSLPPPSSTFSTTVTVHNPPSTTFLSARNREGRN